VVSQKGNVVGGRDASVGCTEIKLIDGDNFALMEEIVHIETSDEVTTVIA
jgi:hypothetical protein